MGQNHKISPLVSARRFWPLGLVGLGFFIAANAHDSGIRFNWTASAPLGFYRVGPPRLARGELALVCLPAPVEDLGLVRGYLPKGDCPGGSSPVLKQIVALPGDTVELTEAFLAVNGRVLVQAPLRQSDSLGRALEHAPLGTRGLAPGQAWVLGVNPARSWDSRYFGPIPIGSIVGTGRPLLTLVLEGP